MKNVIKIALAGMFAASSLGGIAMAQTATTTMAPDATTTGSTVADDNYTIVRLSSLNNDTDRQQYERLSLVANDASQVQEAQAEVAANPALAAQLQAENVQMENIIEVDTAANGGKIIYVR
ncbi:hypothetical protein [Ciceribacter sp. L1K22]|uniref:hypothetical protein n=1 Tax=Ciceribacter sp. L1K22 TaxID=2820275 RepID=UPI001ABECE1A|nr:hypothetical protein [Ciceribacter sp. L1K22]MBO3760831.1 hypothetical protein [Ciceribacter sp. L1K22]